MSGHGGSPAFATHASAAAIAQEKCSNSRERVHHLRSRPTTRQVPHNKMRSAPTEHTPPGKRRKTVRTGALAASAWCNRDNAHDPGDSESSERWVFNEAKQKHRTFFNGGVLSGALLRRRCGKALPLPRLAASHVLQRRRLRQAQHVAGSGDQAMLAQMAQHAREGFGRNAQLGGDQALALLQRDLQAAVLGGRGIAQQPSASWASRLTASSVCWT